MTAVALSLLTVSSAISIFLLNSKLIVLTDDTLVSIEFVVIKCRLYFTSLSLFSKKIFANFKAKLFKNLKVLTYGFKSREELIAWWY